MNEKSETRNPKIEGNPKPEFRTAAAFRKLGTGAAGVVVRNARRRLEGARFIAAFRWTGRILLSPTVPSKKAVLKHAHSKRCRDLRAANPVTKPCPLLPCRLEGRVLQPWSFLRISDFHRLRSSCAALLVAFAPTTLRAAPLPPDWKHVQTVHVDQTGLLKLSVPLETLDAARPALADLRLYDDAGREVPFRIERPTPAPRAVRSARNFRVTLAGNATIATFATDLAQPLDRVTLETPASDFIKAVTLEGSNDGQSWLTVAREQLIFRRDGASRLHLEFAPAVWAHLRVTVDDRRAEAIPLTGATVHAADPAPTPAEPLELKLVERDESAGQTRFTLLAAGARVALAGLQIEATDPLFTRQVTLAYRDYVEGEVRESVLARGTVYRVALEGQPATSNLSFAAEAILPTRELILTVKNGDSPPLNVAAIRATRRPVYAAWLATQPGPFHFLSGNAKCAAPRYDLAALGASVSARLVQSPTVTALAANPAYRAPEPLPEIQDVGTAIDLAKWKYRKRVELAKPGVQQLELDLETLSRAATAFEDLRLVRGGQQIPYLLERTSITRSFAPTVEKADDPKRPTVSRWRIRLPHPALPVTQLVCETDAPFFKRDVSVTEQVPDERGNAYTVTRASTTWTRTLEQRKEKLVLSLSPPVGDALMVEIESGDNPPLALKNFALRHPVTRVIFKTGSDAAPFLYYGNAQASCPRYDIDLVARQLLAAEKAKATLGQAEPLKKSRWSDAGDLGGKAGWIFWVVLGVVVVALLFVIARLLPKSQE
jgi:hypothetical protein